MSPILISATRMARKLTKKQRGFVKDYIKTGNGTKAALKNYDTQDHNTAHVIASENLLKPTIALALKDAIPDDLLTEVHLEGLRATRSVSLGDDYGTDDVVDYAVRHKYLDTAYKLKGSYAPEKSLTINVDIEPSERIKELARKLKDNLLHT